MKTTGVQARAIIVTHIKKQKLLFSDLLKLQSSFAHQKFAGKFNKPKALRRLGALGKRAAKDYNMMRGGYVIRLTKADKRELATDIFNFINTNSLDKITKLRKKC